MLTNDSLIIAPDKSEISIKIQPQESEIKAVEITQLINGCELPQLFVIEDNVIRAADLINLATKEVSLSVDNKSSQDREAEIVVAKQIDAKLEIEFSDDEMKAYAVITAPYGGERIDLSDLMFTLSQHNLTQALHDDGLDEFLFAANEATPGKTSRYHIISGTPPVDGEDSRFQYFVDTMEKQIRKPKMAENGKVNMHELGDILTVKVAAPLIRRHPPTDGIAGKTVLGEPISPTPGQCRDFNVGEGTEISNSDENLLIASRVGMPRALENGLAIDDVLEIKNVDVGSGNIHFEGSVMISGDVCEGLMVVADGSITVGGSVNSATLEAKGNIAVKNGIVGKKGTSENGGHSCKISAGGSVDAKFIQYCQVKAGGNISAQTHILHSKIDSNANVTVTNSTGSQGTLFGGEVSAGEMISAVELGGAAGSRTLLKIEGPVQRLRESRKDLNKSLQEEHGLLKQLLSAHEKVGQLEPGKKKQQLLHKLKCNVDRKIELVMNIQRELAINEKATVAFISKASIHSLRNLQQGVQLEIDGNKIITNKEYKTTVTRLNQGKLHICCG